jgi:hypothetical protein
LRALISRNELAELGRITHRLSNFVTMLVNYAELLSASVTAPEFELVMILTGVIANTEAYVRKLLWRLGRLDK